jgi:hypothetical protein
MLRLPVYGLGLWMLRVNSVIRRVFIVSRNRLKGDFSYLMIIKALLFLLKKLVYCDWLRHRVWTESRHSYSEEFTFNLFFWNGSFRSSSWSRNELHTVIFLITDFSGKWDENSRKVLSFVLYVFRTYCFILTKISIVIRIGNFLALKWLEIGNNKYILL